MPATASATSRVSVRSTGHGRAPGQLVGELLQRRGVAAAEEEVVAGGEGARHRGADPAGRARDQRQWTKIRFGHGAGLYATGHPSGVVRSPPLGPGGLLLVGARGQIRRAVANGMSFRFEIFTGLPDVLACTTRPLPM